jgi:hypothetical protein
VNEVGKSDFLRKPVHNRVGLLLSSATTSPSAVNSPDVTVPEAGTYWVDWGCDYVQAIVGSANPVFMLYKNGASTGIGSHALFSNVNEAAPLFGSTQLVCAAGDVLRMYYYSGTGTSRFAYPYMRAIRVD